MFESILLLFDFTLFKKKYDERSDYNNNDEGNYGGDDDDDDDEKLVETVSNILFHSISQSHRNTFPHHNQA